MNHIPSPPPVATVDGCIAQLIAHTALTLCRSHPQAPVLEVLDLAMEGYRGGEFPDFDRPGLPPTCSAFPPGPFASLLRVAFAPTWSDSDFIPPPAGTPAATADTSGQMWALQVLAEFADRYGLTNARERWHYVF